MTTKTFTNGFLTMVLVCAPTLLLAHNNSAQAFDSVLFDGQVVEDSVLEEMRGGFVSPEGIKVDIGISRTISIDGVLQTPSSYVVSQFQINGATFSYSSPNILIQNKIDNRAIDAQTTLNVNVVNYQGHMEDFMNDIRSSQNLRASQEAQFLK